MVTATGMSRDARFSTVASGSGANSEHERSSANWRSGIGVVASKRASRVQLTAASSGRQAATATSAPSMPNSATATGASTAPRPVLAT